MKHRTEFVNGRLKAIFAFERPHRERDTKVGNSINTVDFRAVDPPKVVLFSIVAESSGFSPGLKLRRFIPKLGGSEAFL